MNSVKTYILSKEELAARFGALKEQAKAKQPNKAHPVIPPQVTNSLNRIRAICARTEEMYFSGMSYHEAFNQAKREEWI